jgi:uncharacterized protein (DUF1501 family)
MTIDRRKFLTGAGSALSTLALATQARHFAAVNALASEAAEKKAKRGTSDYRALVCILLNGGNDGNNTLVPLHNDSTLSSYDVYAAPRAAQGLAIPRSQLLPVMVPRLYGLDYGLHPSLGPAAGQGGINSGIHELWGQGKLAIVSNMGTLLRPMTRAQYLQQPSWRPYQLFSHSDQIQQQQSSRSDSPSVIGWGGRIADRTNASINPAGRVPMITSISGTQLFTLGQQTTPLAIKDAATPLSDTLYLYASCCGGPLSDARSRALKELRQIDLDSDLVKAMSHIMDQAESATSALGTYQEVTVPFPQTALGNQLKQVARVIKKRDELNINRQLFFVELRGFDTHQNQLYGPSSQTALLLQVSQAMRAFYDEMVVQGLSDQVTSFTLSDFGRTMTSSGVGAGVGTDHGWGNHMFVLGGAVAGGDIYGSLRPDGSGEIYPNLRPGGPDDIDHDSSPRGRWLPTTSVEQFAATLVRWYGLSENDIKAVFPQISNFPVSDLGFMNS